MIEMDCMVIFRIYLSLFYRNITLNDYNKQDFILFDLASLVPF